LLGRALVYTTFSEMAQPYAHAMAVTECAHAAEILIKARIAEEDLVLIFAKLPKPTGTRGKLNIRRLLDEGRTITYGELPDSLWAATGFRVPNLDQYKKFGKLRNIITHLRVPNTDLPGQVYRYAFQVIEPMIYRFWKSDIIAAYERFDEEAEYVIEQLAAHHIKFTRRGLG
jgi:hypothetical protein